MKLGLKLWSRNENYVAAATKLFNQGIYDYIELFTVPGSANYIKIWQCLDIPFILHAPHSMAGFNPAIAEREAANFTLLPEVEQYREALNPKYIIFHPGLDGQVDETIRQFCEIRNKFPDIHKISLVENKPEVGLNAESCVGSTPQEIARIKEETGFGFCFDVGHSIYAANAGRIEPYELIRDFIHLQPEMFHLSDGDGKSCLDSHLNYGQGNFDLSGILQLLPEDAFLTLETDKVSENSLDDFAQDVKYLNHLQDL